MPRTTAHTHSPRGRGVPPARWRHAAAAPLLLAALLPACTANPLASSDRDYGRRIGVPERTREIDAFRPDDYLTRPARTLDEAAAEADALRRGAPSFDDRARVELAIEDVRAAALTNNLDLRVALVAPAIARARLSEEEAAFEATFTTDFRWTETDAATATDLASAQARVQRLVPAVDVPLRTGGTARVALPMSRSSDNNQFRTLNPSYTTDLEFSISHQLLRGAGRRANTHAIRVAAYDRRATLAQTKLEAIRQLANADRAYWRLFRARAELDVAQQQLELAQSQLARAERQANAGTVPEIEVIRAQAGVASRLEAIFIAHADVLRTQRELKRLINAPELDIGGQAALVTTTDPEPLELLFDVEALAASALARRMELLELELRLAQDASTIEFTENQALPLLTADYTYRINGLGGTLGDSFELMSDRDFADWELGLRAQIPIGNEAAKSRVRAAILTRLQRLRTQEARRVAIRQEVYDAVDQTRSTWQRVLAARQSVVLNTRAFEAEQRQFGVGRVTSNDVLEAAAALADAQVAEIRAITDYQLAKIDLAVATGMLLGAAGVRFDEETYDQGAFRTARTAPPIDTPDDHRPELLDATTGFINVAPEAPRPDRGPE